MTFNELRYGDGIFIDANIFIYNFGARSQECRELLLRCAKGDLAGYTLTSVIAEVLHRLMIAEALEKGHLTEKNPLKKLREKPEIIKKLTTYSKNVEKISEMNIKIITLTNELIMKSAKIRITEGLLTNDSLIVAALKDANLVNLATNDNDFNNIKWLSVFKPSDLQSC